MTVVLRWVVPVYLFRPGTASAGAVVSRLTDVIIAAEFQWRPTFQRVIGWSMAAGCRQRRQRRESNDDRLCPPSVQPTIFRLSPGRPHRQQLQPFIAVTTLMLRVSVITAPGIQRSKRRSTALVQYLWCICYASTHLRHKGGHPVSFLSPFSYFPFPLTLPSPFNPAWGAGGAL